jgi:amino acid transporter
MKKTVLTYGLIAGAIVTAFMIYGTYSYYNNPDFKGSEVLGYSGMLVAFAFVFIGIKSFRDKQNDGIITFGKALKIGSLIAFMASCIYVGVWLIEYYCFFPDFMDKYAASAIEKLKASNISTIELKIKTDEMNMYREWYKSPLMVILMTFMEILPLGLIVAVISSLLLKRKVKAV